MNKRLQQLNEKPKNEDSSMRPTLNFEGVFSWDKPIEQEILEFCQSMARQWNDIEKNHSSKTIREGAKNFIMAYHTVAEHIVKQMKFREKIKNV